MTISEIRNALTAQLDVCASLYGESSVLTDAQNKDVTDQLASICATVNPTNNYPPVKK